MLYTWSWGPFSQDKVLLCLTWGSQRCYWAICSAFFNEGPPLMRCLCFISPLTKKEALQTATFTPLLAALLNELKPFSIYTWKYTTHKKIRVMVSVQAFLLTVKNCGGWGGTAWCTEIFIWMRKKHRLLIGDWSWKVYRFFRKDDWGVKHLTIGLKKTPAAWNLYESAKYESLHCGCQTRLSCVAKRAPWTETRGG